MSTDQVRQAAAMLDRARADEAPLSELPGNLAPLTKAEGFAIAARVEERSGSPLYGWKIAATSAAGQAHLDVDEPIAGRLLAEWIIPDGGRIELGRRLMDLAEVEFAFTLGRDLPPSDTPYTEAQVLAATESMHPALELPDTRLARFASVGVEQLVADNACAAQLVLGPASPAAWREEDLAAAEAHATVTFDDGRTEDVSGIGSNVLAGPLDALTWLVNELSVHGIGLRAGQVVTTGTVVVPIPLDGVREVRADFGRHGTVSVRCTRRPDPESASPHNERTAP